MLSLMPGAGVADGGGSSHWVGGKDLGSHWTIFSSLKSYHVSLCLLVPHVLKSVF